MATTSVKGMSLAQILSSAKSVRNQPIVQQQVKPSLWQRLLYTFSSKKAPSQQSNTPVSPPTDQAYGEQQVLTSSYQHFNTQMGYVPSQNMMAYAPVMLDPRIIQQQQAMMQQAMQAHKPESMKNIASGIKFSRVDQAQVDSLKNQNLQREGSEKNILGTGTKPN